MERWSVMELNDGGKVECNGGGKVECNGGAWIGVVERQNGAKGER